MTDAAWVGARVADAVHHAHGNDVTHLELAPGNVLFRHVDGAWDVPKVGDWGLSTLSLDGEGFHPRYAAPEQLDPDAYGGPDERTDIYRIGALCYELFTGEPPFGGDRSEAARATLDEKPPAPTWVRSDLPAAVDRVLGRALAREKDDRYQSALEFRDELQGL